MPECVIAAVLLVVSAGEATREPPATVTCYVSSISGDDRNAGSLHRPVRSIQRAQGLVRAHIVGGMTADLVVYLRGGTYYVSETLRFDERDSGRAGFRVRYQSYPGEQAVLVGGAPITGWRRHSGPIHAADVGRDSGIGALTDNGVPATLARTPNRGYLSVASAAEQDGLPCLGYGPGDLPATFDPSGVQALVWAGYDELWDGGKNYNWEATLVRVASADLAARTLTLAGPTIRRLHAHNRYYLRGALAFLDRPGEFLHDASQGILYYWPREEPIESRHIVGSSLARLIEVTGSSHEHQAEDIVFDGLTLELTAPPEEFGPSMYLACDGLLYITNARRIAVRNCTIRHAGLAGIALDRASRGHVIEGNLIEDCAFSGISAAGYWIGAAPFADEEAAFVNRGHRIARNHIRRCGRLIPHASGISLYQSGENAIENNLIEDMPRYGIRMEGHSLGGMLTGPLGGQLFGRPITSGNRHDFVYTRNNRIMRNELRRCMEDSQDGGAICSYGTGHDNVVAGNLIHDMTSAVTEGSIAGIYLDDASNEFTVEGNAVARLHGVRYVYPMIIKGVRNVVRDNIISDNEATACVYVLETPYGGLAPEEGAAVELAGELTFERNIFVRSGGTVYTIYPWRDDMVLVSDGNVIHEPAAQVGCVIDWRWEPWAAWCSRLGSRYERTSLLGDPLLRDAGGLDFGLRPTSPAAAPQRRAFELSAVGLRGEDR